MDKERMFDKHDRVLRYNQETPTSYSSLPTEKAGRFFFRASAEDFKKIPGSPIAYWASKNLIDSFSNFGTFNDHVDTAQGMKTLNNDRFIREWHEVSIVTSSIKNTKHPKWFPINHGGEYRKWYGNNESFLNWEKNGAAIKSLAINKLKFHGNHYAAMRSSVATRELMTDFRGTGQSKLKLSLSAASAMHLRISEKAKCLRPLTACRRSGVFSIIQA